MVNCHTVCEYFCFLLFFVGETWVGYWTSVDFRTICSLKSNRENCERNILSSWHLFLAIASPLATYFFLVNHFDVCTEVEDRHEFHDCLRSMLPHIHRTSWSSSYHHWVRDWVSLLFVNGNVYYGVKKWRRNSQWATLIRLKSVASGKGQC